MLVTELEKYIQNNHDEFLNELRKLDLSIVNTTIENRWSVVEIIDHVTLVEKMVNSVLEKSAIGNVAPKKRSVVDFDVDILLSGLDYEVIMKVEAFPNSEPNNNQNYNDVFSRLNETRKLTLKNLENSKYTDMKLFVFPHKMFGELNYYNWLYFTGKHEEIHLKQLKKNTKLLS